MSQSRSDAVEYAANCISCRGILRTLFSISILVFPFTRLAAAAKRFIGVGSDILQRPAGPELTFQKILRAAVIKASLASLICPDHRRISREVSATLFRD